MRNFIQLSLLAFPASALASGGEVLSLLWLELLLLITVLCSVVFTKITLRWRLATFLAYFLGHVLAYVLVGQLPYREHKLFVDFISIAMPLVAWLAVFFMALYNRKHNNSFNRTAAPKFE